MTLSSQPVLDKRRPAGPARRQVNLPAKHYVIVEDVDLHVLQAGHLVVLVRHEPADPVRQLRRLVQRHVQPAGSAACPLCAAGLS